MPALHRFGVVLVALVSVAFIPACGTTRPVTVSDDGGSGDAGVTGDGGAAPDGGPLTDAGSPADAGSDDAGPGDAGEPSDAGPQPDAGEADAGQEADGGDCDGGCGFSRLCCAGQCINPANNPDNCGTCGKQCTGTDSFCTNNACQATPCSLAGSSCDADGGSCCGGACCGADQLCCDTEGPVAGGPECYTPTTDQPTCPEGCAPLCVSDRDAKRDIVPVNDRAVLDALAALPISTWSYKDDADSVRHLGPMAQDFRAAFHVGATDKGYDPVDAHGIAFSSIRALYAMVQDQNERLARLERENAELRKRLDEQRKAR